MMQRTEQGEAMGAIAAALGDTVEPVWLWVKRLDARGADGLPDHPAFALLGVQRELFE